MFSAAMSNSASLSEEATTTVVSFSSGTKVQNFTASPGHIVSTIPSHHQQPQKIKKKRNTPGNPDPDAEVVALSPKALLATNRYVCEICKKGFQRDQNLQLHRRGHNLPWKLKQRNKEIKKRVYVCPEASCVHHNPSRALGDLTGIKKHYCRKHGEKKWKCNKCSRIYAVQSDWKAHSKTCGTREYRCECGTPFSRKDSFITHRAFCDALAQETARLGTNQLASSTNPMLLQSFFPFQNQMMTMMMNNHPWDPPSQENPNPSLNNEAVQIKTEAECFLGPSLSPSSPYVQVMLQEQNQKNMMMTMTNPFLGTTLPHVHVPSYAVTSPHLSSTALLIKAATVDPTATTGPLSTMPHVTQHISTGEFDRVTHQVDPPGHHYMGGLMTRDLRDPLMTKDFLGLTAYVDGGVEYDVFKSSQQDFGLFGTVTNAAPETWESS